MSLLPPALARELVEQLYESKIEALPGLRGLPAEVRAALCMSMKPIKVRSNHDRLFSKVSEASAALVVGTQALKTDVIFREGERADSMYVIEQGAVELSRHAVVLTHLDQGAAFGEDSLVGRQHIGRAGEEEGERVEEHQIKRVRASHP